MEEFLIIGGGIGGLSLALGLQRIGRKVAVLERTDTFTDVGAGLTVGPNMMHALAWLGVAEDTLRNAMIPEHGGVVDMATGELRVSNRRGSGPLERYGQPYAQMHRADMQRILLEAVRRNDPDALRPGHAITGISEAPGSVTAHFANGRSVQGQWLIGADGIRSVVRDLVFPGNEPVFTGYVAWRGLVPMERLGHVPIYPDSAILIGPRRSLARYRVRNGQLLNYAAFAESSEWAEEGWSIRSDISDLLDHYEGATPFVRQIVEQTPAGECFKWGLFDRDPLPTWTAGRITLLGDAAHPMLPFLGQGAAMAVEDAVILARTLEVVQDPMTAFPLYEKLRRERTTLATEGSRAAVREFHSPDTKGYDPSRHRDAESLGLFAYNPATAPIDA